MHPYRHSSSPIYGNWQHIMEPLVEYDYKRKDYVGILAESDQLEVGLDRILPAILGGLVDRLVLKAAAQA